jgi:hypothetical protein
MAKISLRPRRILDFDIENRPLTYLGGDYTTAEVTAIAWSFVGSDTISSALLGAVEGEEMLSLFREAFDQADMVTGHYIRKHDLPIINGALLEYSLPPLGDKLTEDTKLDLIKRKDFSASQESLAATLGVTAPKVHMDQHSWREANRLTARGLEATKQRVEGDVLQHKMLRARLLELGMLHPPRVWRS